MDNFSLQPHLMPGETLLWSGKQQKRFRLDRRYAPLLFILPFFLFFISIPIIGAFESDHTNKAPTDQRQPSSSDSASNPDVKPEKKTPLAVRILGPVMVFLMISGFFAYMAVMMGASLPTRVAAYGLTNQRLVVLTGKKATTIRSIALDALTNLQMTEYPDGLGKITFGPDDFWPYGRAMREAKIHLENIAEPRRVFQLILEARTNDPPSASA